MTAGPRDAAGHVSAERLAAAALAEREEPRSAGSGGTGGPGGPDSASAEELTPVERTHVAACAVCRYEFDALRRVRDLSVGGDQELLGLERPAAAVWERIVAEVSEPAGLTPAGQVGQAGTSDRASAVLPVPSGGRDLAASSTSPSRPRRRGRLMVAVIATVVGLAVGIGGTVIARLVADPAPVVLARTSLSALPGEHGAGSAELVRDKGTLDLRVQLDATPTPDRFYQLWLLDSAGDKMYDLGSLPPTGTASYPIPAELGQGLGSYTTVDVSVEPYDGNPAHSHHSLVRGQLPS